MSVVGGPEKEEVWSMGGLGPGRHSRMKRPGLGRVLFLLPPSKGNEFKESPLFPQVHSASECKLSHLWDLDLDYGFGFS